MTIWIFLIGIIIGLVISLALLFTVAVIPLRRKIERLTQDLKSYRTDEEKNLQMIEE